MNTRHHAGLILILVLAAVARLFRFPSVPHGLNQDEVSAGYETMALLAAGTDRWGTRWPVYFTAFGSGQNVLLSYLNMPFVAVLGPTPLGLRLLPALLGVATVGLVYALTATVADRRAGLIAALLLALCPWHVMMSRWSLESNLLPPVMLFAVWVLVVAYRSPRRWLMPLSLAPMALTFYAYAAATLVVALFVAAFLATEWRTVRARPGAVAASVGVFGLLSLPYGLFLLVNHVTKQALPFVPLLPGSRVSEINTDGMIVENLRFFLYGFDDGMPWNVLSPYLPLGLVVIPLAAVGLLFAVRRRAWPIVIWAAAALPMVFLIQLNVNRFNVIFLPLIMLAAIGMDDLARSMRGARAGTAVITALLSVALIYNTVFVVDYIRGYNDTVRVDFSDGIGGALRVAARNAEPGEPVYVSEVVPLNYLYVLFHQRVDPRDFREQSEYYISEKTYFVRNVKQYYFHASDPALLAAPTYVAMFREDEKATCAGTDPDNRTLLATVGSFRVVRCLA
ncbi:glycosyltransferase family 39 protein [Actinoplanes sp. NPDC051861]|uniref:glycosyltransferase family 39 protein n=1 Tax=Actinoplanes sp. NPDC051861 TaxID=3155170 RepID=UPI003445C191